MSDIEKRVSTLEQHVGQLEQHVNLLEQELQSVPKIQPVKDVDKMVDSLLTDAIEDAWKEGKK